jgi:hypothetical protein
MPRYAAYGLDSGVGRGGDVPSPELCVLRSCACVAEEKKCDLHAGPLDFGIGLVSFCYRPRLRRMRVGAGFGVGVKEEDK